MPNKNVALCRANKFVGNNKTTPPSAHVGIQHMAPHFRLFTVDRLNENGCELDFVHLCYFMNFFTVRLILPMRVYSDLPILLWPSCVNMSTAFGRDIVAFEAHTQSIFSCVSFTFLSDVFCSCSNVK